MEGLDLIGGISTIFGFLAVCLAMIWKVVSDKKDNDKIKDIGKQIAEILTYITKEKEATKQRQDEMQKQIAENTSAIAKITEILDEISKKMNKFAPKSKNSINKK